MASTHSKEVQDLEHVPDPGSKAGQREDHHGAVRRSGGDISGTVRFCGKHPLELLSLIFQHAASLIVHLIPRLPDQTFQKCIAFKSIDQRF